MYSRGLFLTPYLFTSPLLHTQIQATILPVEVPLVQQKLDAVEVALSRGLKDLNWRSPDIAFYINESMDLVKVSLPLPRLICFPSF